MVLPVRGEEHVAEVRVLLPAAIGDGVGGDVLVAEEPPPVPGDAHRQHLPPLPVDVPQHRRGGEERDLVRAGDAAEEDGHLGFVHRPNAPFLSFVTDTVYYTIHGGYSQGGPGAWEWPQSAVKGNQQEQRGFPLWDGEGDSCIWQYQNDYKRLQRLLLPHKEFPAFEGNTCFFLQEQGYNGADQR